MRLCSFHDGDVVRVGILFEDRVFTSTGTPGAVVIRFGDIVRCEVDGFPALENRVA